MKRILFLCIGGLLGLGIQAQSIVKTGSEAHSVVANSSKVRIHPNLSIPTYLAFEEGKAWSFANWKAQYKAHFELADEYDFDLLSQQSDELGYTHYRYKQSYAGFPIDYAHVILHVKNNTIKSINGIAYRKSFNKSVSISEQAALQTALNEIGATTYKWDIPAEEQHLKMEQSDPEATYYPNAELVYLGADASVDPDQVRLVYKFNIYAQQPFSRNMVYVDAQNGELFQVDELLHTGNVPGIAQTAYSGTQPIMADSFADGVFRLRETGRGLGVITLDMNKSTNHSQAVDFIDSNNVWANFNANKDQFATDAHWGAEVTWDYFDSIHNRNSIDGNGFALRSYIHYGNNYNNAFWDGQRMTYGDGNGTSNPLTSIDIAGHEIAHGLTNFSAGLIYRKESGALNESFSDIFGAAVEHHGKPAVSNWLLGEDIGMIIRSMSNPNQLGDPDSYGGLNWIPQPQCSPTSGNDWCGVHTNSGVQNFWFYLLSDGGTGVNDVGNSYAVNGLGITEASKIAFRNLTVYLTPTSDYDDARFYGILSASDIFGGCSPEVESTTNAWYAVNVGGAYTPGVSAQFVSVFDSSFCTAPALVYFSSNSNNVSTFRWDFGDGDTSNLSEPVHLYDSSGIYTVSLIVDGGVCGQDTIVRTGYIRVDTSILCSYTMDRNSLKVLTDCNATVYDHGGLNGDYEVQSSDTLLLAPSNADWIQMTFNSLTIESGYGGNCNHDYLEIFDGANTNARSLGRYCTSNPPTVINSTSPYVTIVLFSDDLQARAGFNMDWACQTASQLPVADFHVKFDSSCAGYNEFRDDSQGGIQTWLWSFGDGNTSTEQNPNHEYQTNGTFNVTLTVSNSMGTNTSFSKSVYVNRTTAPVTRDDTSCVNGDVKLAATGTGLLNWYRDATGNQRFHTGDTLRINGLANDTTFYVSSLEEYPRVVGTPIFMSGNGYQSDTTAEMYFDVYKPTLIESVIIRSNRRADRRIDLKNSQGEIIDSRLINVNNIPTQIFVYFEVAPGTNYSLSIGSRNPSAYVNTTGASYPYTFGNFMSITGSSMGATAYPFFYYFTAREIACLSTRTPVKGLVDTTCIITGLKNENQLNQSIQVYPNPSSDQVQVLLPSEKNLRNWYLLDLQGRRVSVEASKTGNQLKLELSAIPVGVYFIQFEFDDSIETKKIVRSH